MIYKAPLCLNFGGTELLRAQSVSYYRWMFRRLDRAFFVARHMERKLFSMVDPLRCVYTGNGVDHEFFYPHSEAIKRDEIICVGNLRWQKDYPVLITAFQSIADRFPSYRVRIFGEGPERAKLERQISDAGLKGRVILEGMNSQEVIRKALHTAKLYVICSKTEGFPKALIEAMACGLPVLATDVGECPSVLDRIVETVPAGNSCALAVALSTLLSNESEKLSSIAAACQIRSKDYSWSRVSDIVEAEYDKLLSVD